jgi:hypothetical protein
VSLKFVGKFQYKISPSPLFQRGVANPKKKSPFEKGGQRGI